MKNLHRGEEGQARLGPLLLLALGGLLIIGVLIIGLFLLLERLPFGPAQQATPTLTATRVIQPSPSPTLTSTSTATLVVVASPTPTPTATATMVPSPTPTPVSEIPPTGLGPLEAVMGGVLLSLVIFISRRLRLAR